MADDLGERTEEATPRRRQEAREQGIVARSHDLSSAMMLLLATVGIWVFAMSMFMQGRSLLVQALADSAALSIDRAGAWQALRGLGTGALRLALPILAITWLAAFAAQFIQIGWLFAPKAVAPTTARINPLRGLRRILGVSGMFRSGLDVLKVGIVLSIGAMTVVGFAGDVATLPYLSAMQGLSRAGEMMLELAMRLVGALLLLGLIDFLYQRCKHTRDLRMTRQEVRDELKETDGDPETRRRRRRVQQQVTTQRIAAGIPTADVIVTDSEMVSIAIRYDASTMAAPIVVARGADQLAVRIRGIAAQHGIPIVERRELARALFKHAHVEREIPAEHYKVVAEILAYVYRLRGRNVG